MERNDGDIQLVSELKNKERSQVELLQILHLNATFLPIRKSNSENPDVYSNPSTQPTILPFESHENESLSQQEEIDKEYVEKFLANSLWTPWAVQLESEEKLSELVPLPAMDRNKQNRTIEPHRGDGEHISESEPSNEGKPSFVDDGWEVKPKNCNYLPPKLPLFNTVKVTSIPIRIKLDGNAGNKHRYIPVTRPCKYCGIVVTLRNYKSHVQIVHKRELPIPKPWYMNRNGSAQNSHQKYGSRPKKCRTCKTTLFSYEQLKCHVVARHEGRFLSICSKCDYVCQDAGALRQHMGRRHSS